MLALDWALLFSSSAAARGPLLVHSRTEILLQESKAHAILPPSNEKTSLHCYAGCVFLLYFAVASFAFLFHFDLALAQCHFAQLFKISCRFPIL